MIKTLSQRLKPPRNSLRIWKRHLRLIPGGTASMNRAIDPPRIFSRAKGAYLWDVEGNRYVDYHAAFSPYLLGHNDPDVEKAVINAIREKRSLIGAGSTPWEGELAELLLQCVPTLEQVQIANTGSEATYQAVRIARAATGRDEIIVMQGGYNGWHNDVAFNLMDPLEKMADDAPGLELPLRAISAGIPNFNREIVHAVQFNDLNAVESVLKTGRVGCMITEPVLQNIGVVLPKPGYLQGLRSLCDHYGALLIFDEVKTGFRHALGGYQSLCGVTPDLSTFGKAVANGYPMGVIGGKRKYMAYLAHPDLSKRVLMAGTYNAHPAPAAAAIATLKKLKTRRTEIYSKLEALGKMMEDGLRTIFSKSGIPATVARAGSAFVVYFMDQAPANWLDVATHHRMDLDREYRRLLIENGVFHFPTPAKQGSISFAHSAKDIATTLEITEKILKNLKRSVLP